MANHNVSQVTECKVQCKHTCPVQSYLGSVDQIQQPLQPLVLQFGAVNLILVVYDCLLNESIDVNRCSGQSFRQKGVEWLKRGVCHVAPWQLSVCKPCAVQCDCLCKSKNIEELSYHHLLQWTVYDTVPFGKVCGGEVSFRMNIRRTFVLDRAALVRELSSTTQGFILGTINNLLLQWHKANDVFSNLTAFRSCDKNPHWVILLPLITGWSGHTSFYCNLI